MGKRPPCQGAANKAQPTSERRAGGWCHQGPSPAARPRRHKGPLCRPPDSAGPAAVRERRGLRRTLRVEGAGAPEPGKTGPVLTEAGGGELGVLGETLRGFSLGENVSVPKSRPC